MGCLFAFAFGDKLGRKRTIFVGVTCNWVGAVLQIASFQLPQMIVGRLINGFGMGRQARRIFNCTRLTILRCNIIHMPCVPGGGVARASSWQARCTRKRLQHCRRLPVDVDELWSVRENWTFPMAVSTGLPTHLPNYRAELLSVHLRFTSLAAVERPPSGGPGCSCKVTQPA